jgi:fructose-1,6-bisphosphatase-3
MILASCFLPQGGFQPSSESEGERLLMARMHKAISIIQFKLEAQVIRRRPEYGLAESVACWKKLTCNHQGSVAIDAKMCMHCCDNRFPTIDPEDPYTLTASEKKVVEHLKLAFLHSEKLQKHARFLFEKGRMFNIFNGNLLYHGCIPMDTDGSFTTLRLHQKDYSGKSLMEALQRLAQVGYFTTDSPIKKQEGLDAMWYLWCGPCSPLFGKAKMATFERYFIQESSVHKEPRNIYYTLRDDEAMVRRILEQFDLDPEKGHVINGHVPVIVKKNESPLKAGGKLIVIDGGFSPAYQKKTGIAGYTLVYNSWGMLLATHHNQRTKQATDPDIHDIDCTTETIESRSRRIRIRHTDLGREIVRRIETLTALHDAYKNGLITQTSPKGKVLQ